MKKEISSGAVIYKLINNKLYFLIEYMSLGHISLVKGHQEKNETLSETALREIKEETNLYVLLDTNFSHTITYSPFEGIIKDVIFYVAKVVDNNQKAYDNHDNEVIKIEFHPFNEAYQLLTHQSDKETLSLAYEYIKKKERL